MVRVRTVRYPPQYEVTLKGPVVADVAPPGSKSMTWGRSRSWYSRH